MLALLGPLLDGATRNRWKRLATMKKHREVLHSYLEYDSFNPNFERLVEPKEVPGLRDTLRRLGAGKRCTVVPMDDSKRAWEAPFEETLEALLSTGSLRGPDGLRAEDHIVLACLPGRLAFVQVDYVLRKIIFRPT